MPVEKATTDSMLSGYLLYDKGNNEKWHESFEPKER